MYYKLHIKDPLFSVGTCVFFWRNYVCPMQGSILRILPDCCADQRRELNMLFSSFVWSGIGDSGGSAKG